MEEAQRYTGQVKFFNHKYKFGFIRVDETEEEVYVHEKDCKDTLKDNDKVLFTMGEAKRGKVAKSVRLNKD